MVDIVEGPGGSSIVHLDVVGAPAEAIGELRYAGLLPRWIRGENGQACGKCPYFCPYSWPDGAEVGGAERMVAAQSRRSQRYTPPDERPGTSYDIFEGTEQIQQLVIARAISGWRIE